MYGGGKEYTLGFLNDVDIVAWSDVETKRLYAVWLKDGSVARLFTPDSDGNTSVICWVRYETGFIPEDDKSNPALLRALAIADQWKVSVETTYTCADCGDTGELEDDEYTNLDGERICRSCDENYGTCDRSRCLERARIRDLSEFNSRYYCSECIDMVSYVCADCDDRESVNDDGGRNADGDRVCDSCAESYFYCESCSTRCHNNHYGADGQCDSCFEPESDDDEDEDNIIGATIHDYSYKPRPVFHPSRGLQLPGKLGTYYGIELEVNSTDINAHAEYTLESLNGGDGEVHAYLKRDSSIGEGFEIVTHPHTLAEHRDTWSEFFAAVPRGMTSYKSGKCGMHVHIDRSRLSQMQIRRMLVFVNAPANHQYVCAIAQRTASNYAKLMEKSLTESFSYDRFEALNVCNSNTVELRIFRGSILLKRFMKNLEFTDALVEFCRVTTYRHLDVPHFLEYVSQRKHSYKYLHNYHVELNMVSGKVLTPVCPKGQLSLMDTSVDTAA